MFLMLRLRDTPAGFALTDLEPRETEKYLFYIDANTKVIEKHTYINFKAEDDKLVQRVPQFMM